MTVYYDRDGEPIDFETWSQLFETPYRHVARDEIKSGSKTTTVSTIWLGINFGVGSHRLLFETIVFEQRGGSTGHRTCKRRYATEDEAFEGHNEIVAALKGES